MTTYFLHHPLDRPRLMRHSIPPDSMTPERDQRLIDHERRREAAERFGEGTASRVYTRMELVDKMRSVARFCCDMMSRCEGDAWDVRGQACFQAADMLAKDDAEFFKGRANDAAQR